MLAAWVAGVARLGADIEVDLGPVAAGDAEADALRCWAVVDWMVRCHAPLWLAAGDQPDAAAYLWALEPVTDPGRLSEATPALESAVMVGNDAVVRVWADLVDRAGVGNASRGNNPRRDECWQAITRATNRRPTSIAAGAVAAAEAAIEAGPSRVVPPAWRLAGAVVAEMVDLLAWTAIADATSHQNWSWTAAPALAAAHAAAAVNRALTPITRASRASARQLTYQLATLLPDLATGPCCGPTPESSEQ